MNSVATEWMAVNQLRVCSHVKLKCTRLSKSQFRISFILTNFNMVSILSFNLKDKMGLEST